MENQSTYVVQDRKSREELLRLEEQDRLFTTIMGGVITEQEHPERFKRVLDIGCGPGGWLVEFAEAFPFIQQLIGIDISTNMVKHARERAQEHHVQDRVDFSVMDALRMLEFPDHFFDLVNLRFGFSWIRKWDWIPLVQGIARVTRASGIVRCTEAALPTYSTSEAVMRFYDLFMHNLARAGYLQEEKPTAVIDHLPTILHNGGLKHIQRKEYTYEYASGTREGELFCADFLKAMSTLAPFLQKWVRIEDYTELVKRIEEEIVQPSFKTEVRFVTVWGDFIS